MKSLVELLRLEAEASFLFDRIRERRSEIDSLQLCQRKDEQRIDDLIDQIHMMEFTSEDESAQGEEARIQTDDQRRANDDPTLSMHDWHTSVLPSEVS